MSSDRTAIFYSRDQPKCDLLFRNWQRSSPDPVLESIPDSGPKLQDKPSSDPYSSGVIRCLCSSERLYNPKQEAGYVPAECPAGKLVRCKNSMETTANRPFRKLGNPVTDIKML